MLRLKQATANINNHLSGGTMIAVAAGDEENPIMTKKGLWVAGTSFQVIKMHIKVILAIKARYPAVLSGCDLYIGENSMLVLHIAG